MASSNLGISSRVALAGAAVLAAAFSLPLRSQVANPTFSNVTVHDPSVIKVGARWYVYGSHGASAWTEDLLNWTQVATSVNSGNPAHFNTFSSELSELIAWTTADSLWAADVVQLPDGKFYYYYNVWDDYLGYRSYMGLASADGIEGPFIDQGEIMRGGTNVAGFNPSVHPNTIDPDVFYDRDGQLWMVYGSYSGGIFILRLDQTVGSANFGRPLPGQGWGTKLIGGNHAQIEGPCIIYSPDSEYYYLFLSFGGLGANDGYNIRVARSRNPDGPYVDAAGTVLTNIGGNQSQIAPHGVKLMGNYQFTKQAGEPGAAVGIGYRSPGHNSAYYEPETGKYFLIFHTRFQGMGEFHQVRVHQMYLNSDGWFVVAPHRYAKETGSGVEPARLAGNYKIINHGKAISGTLVTSINITLNGDGSVSGEASGSWSLDANARDITVTIGGVAYRGVIATQWDGDSGVWVYAFTALSADGTALWGSKFAEANTNIDPVIVAQPAHRSGGPGSRVTVSTGAAALPPPTFQWKKNGADLSGATGASYSIASLAAADAGLYSAQVNSSTSVTTNAAIVGLSLTEKLAGVAEEIGSDIPHPNGNTFDQILLKGAAAAFRADSAQNQVTRLSYVDLTNDIVQVEFSGAGTVSIVLQESSGPATATNYNQNVEYMKGHAGIVVTGANETTNLSVFSVGRGTAVNQALFNDNITYDGFADIAFVAIQSSNGKFGGLRTANASYWNTQGFTGVYAPGVEFTGPVYVHDINAQQDATAVLLIGSATGDTAITGGDLAQANNRAVQVSGLVQLRMADGTTSHYRADTQVAAEYRTAKPNQGRLEQNGVDVTAQIVVNP